MDFFYFLVTSSGSWNSHYHANFFNVQGGFLWGFVGALILGALAACAFYFGCCNSSKTSKSANIGTWAISLCLCAVVSYFYADSVIIGDSNTTDNTSVFRAYAFYKANDDYFIKEISQPGVSQTYIDDLAQKKNEIKYNLDKGGDVRFDFDITTAFLAAIFFFITSIVVKRFTIGGKTIPFEKP